MIKFLLNIYIAYKVHQISNIQNDELVYIRDSNTIRYIIDKEKKGKGYDVS